MKPTVPPEPQLTRVQCGACAWMSAAHESPAEAYLEVGAHFVNVHRYAATAAPSEPTPPTSPRFGMTAADVAKREQLARPDLTTEEIIAAAPPTVAPCPTCEGHTKLDDGPDYPVSDCPDCAPPTVAPAAEIAWRLVLASAIGDIALSLAERKTISKVITDALERDRASRSPGHREALEAIVAGNCWWDGSYADCDEAAANPNEDFQGPCPRCIAASVLRGEGPSPGPRAGATQEANVVSLGGLDAATVEARIRDDEKLAHDVGTWTVNDTAQDGVLQAFIDFIRALATPPGQAKGEQR